MIQPIININGTSKDDLINPRLEACDLIMDAIEALRNATPNGRDYPGDTERCLADRQKHYDRLNALRSLHIQIFDEALAIKGQ